MKYLIKFWDKKELVVSEAVGEQVKQAKLLDIGAISIDNALYETKAISYIEPLKENKTPALPEPSGPAVSKETLDKMKKELAEKFGWK